MSIFGDLDAETIPTNAFYIEAGEYTAEITKSLFKVNRDGKRQLAITYSITNEDSEFNGQPVTQFLDLVDEDMTATKMALLPPDEKQKIRKDNAKVKRTLCGDSRHAGLGVSVNDLNEENWNPETLIGTKVDITLSNYGTTNEGVNIKWVNVSE